MLKLRLTSLCLALAALLGLSGVAVASPLTTHVLDTAHGMPAEGVPITLEINRGGPGAEKWKVIASGVTNFDGRVSNFLPDTHVLEVGVYRISFDTAAYFNRIGVQGFYPYAKVVFEIKDPTPHYHIPLLLNPFGYSTYRGS